MKYAIGLMSGTSCDGIDAALISTDGHNEIQAISHISTTYSDTFRDALYEVINQQHDPLLVEKELTEHHAAVVHNLLQEASVSHEDIYAIGFHGQTILHRPHQGLTWQIGNGALLAELTGIDVVCDFRRKDMAAGGQGAPLVPVFHAAIMQNIPKPVAIINIGGVSNVTWLGEEENILAYDTGPGNALLDDWVRKHTNTAYDYNGQLSSQGTVDQNLIQRWTGDKFFRADPPKSLDRNHFSFILHDMKNMPVHDGAATLACLTSIAIAQGTRFFPEPVKQWLISGGGRKNPTIMKQLQNTLTAPVKPIDEIGWDGDMLEAQAFGYLAVRSREGLPLTSPTTTGVTRPISGGAFYQA